MHVRPLDDKTVSADFLARFIAVRLEQGVKVRSVLGVVQRALNELIQSKILLGFRIKLSGRFSRVQQASCTVAGSGVLSRNELSTNVDYSCQTAKLKFSVCGIKVLLSRQSSDNTDSYRNIMQLGGDVSN